MFTGSSVTAISVTGFPRPATLDSPLTENPRSQRKSNEQNRTKYHAETEGTLRLDTDHFGGNDKLYRCRFDCGGRRRTHALGKGIRDERHAAWPAWRLQFKRDFGGHRRADRRTHLRQVRPEIRLHVRPALLHARHASDHLRPKLSHALYRLLHCRTRRRCGNHRLMDTHCRTGSDRKTGAPLRRRTGGLGTRPDDCSSPFGAAGQVRPPREPDRFRTSLSCRARNVAAALRNAGIRELETE